MTVCTTWATEADLPEGCDLQPIHPDVLSEAFLFASEVLWNLTGRKWNGGGCTATIRPSATYDPALTTYRPGKGFGSCPCNQARIAGHALPAIRLPHSPVSAITSVKVDGQTVPASEYVLVDGRWLTGTVKADGTWRTWPCTQRLDLASTEPGTFEVTYTWGRAPSSRGRRAAAILGYELALLWTPGCQGRCRIQAATAITRQGKTVTRATLAETFQQGLTSIPEVDLWVQSIRFGDRNRPATILAPGSSVGAHRRG